MLFKYIYIGYVYISMLKTNPLNNALKFYHVILIHVLTQNDIS